MKSPLRQLLSGLAPAARQHLPNVKKILFSLLVLACSLSLSAQTGERISVSGLITDSIGAPLPNVTVAEKSTTNAVKSGVDGRFTITVANEKAVLLFSSVGYQLFEIRVGSQRNMNIEMDLLDKDLGEVVVIGYGARKKEALTGAISTITSKDIDHVHAGATVSSTLAGKLPGVTFRMPDGRPGAAANIQIRNMGTPLYVIDGIQQDAGQFNNISPNDIESITILKDASAAIYGVQAANGVVVVTTKRGTTGRNNVNVDAYSGWQNWLRFPDVLTNSYDYMRYKADAEINRFGSTGITQEELDKYKIGAEAGPQYRSFNWRDYVLRKNASQNSVNVNINGGSDKVNYYVSASNIFQNSVMGREYKFNRSNIQSNVTAKLNNRLRVGANINGRIETRQNPGVPGGDDYWLARFAVLRNTPLERPYANDNPLYLNDMGEHLETNYAFLNERISGKLKSEWRVLQSIFNVEYDVPYIKGLQAKASYSYYIADHLLNNQEYTYDAYTYRPDTDTYDRTGGATNPWREREQVKQENTNFQVQLNYNRTFGEHTVGATAVSERIKNKRIRNWLHANPVSNNLPLIYFPITDQYQDEQIELARIGYIGRVSYSYANKYFFEASARRDASSIFAPENRVGYFPGVSAGWRITEEPWMQQLIGSSDIVNDIKFRASYGTLGDDRNIDGSYVVPLFAYLPGYNYNAGTAIINGNPVTVSRDKGIPITNLTWTKSTIFDIGLDFQLLKNKLSGTFDYFNRERTGLPAPKNDVVMPWELGYTLPSENLNSDQHRGVELSLRWTDQIGKLRYNVGGNVSYARRKILDIYMARFENSWQEYRASTVNRYANISWGYIADGQFASYDEINNHPVNIDGLGNRTLIPGDLKYKDLNGDGLINDFDQRPIGYGGGAQPNINFGFNIGLAYGNFDFTADFSGASGYTWFQNWEMRWAFQNNGNLNKIFTDRWHRADMYDPNSQWIAGKYPANRFNFGGHSNYNRNSTFWAHNVRYLRARTLELGYTIPASILSRAKIQRARFYLNTYNLFSIDNLSEFGIDPEIVDENGLQFPQNKVVNIGVNLSF